MKKLISLIALLVTLVSANAVTHVATSFLNVRSCQATNGIGVTNLLSTIAIGTTNIMGIIYTNAYGNQITTTNANADYNNLLKDYVPTWVDSLGSAINATYTTTNVTINPGPYFAGIFIRLVGQSGANSAVTFRFFPIPDGEDVSGSNEDNAAADQILISVTANTTTEVRSYTKIDAQKLVGCKGLRLVSITNGDTDATSAITVLECRLCGFQP